MGLHPSLKRGDSLAATRTVLKRVERIKWLMSKGKWSDEGRVLGLPKMKILKIKSAKKIKEKEEKPAEEGATATPAAKKE